MTDTTTTAGKLAVEAAYYAGAKIQSRGRIVDTAWRDNNCPEFAWKSRDYRIKPEQKPEQKPEPQPDQPKPLECWVNVMRSGHIFAFTTEDEAKEKELDGCTRVAVLMREVG